MNPFFMQRGMFKIFDYNPGMLRQFRHWLREEPGRTYRVMVAADEAAGDEVIGYSEVVRQKWYEPGKFEQKYYGHHGGLTPQEMEIPLLALEL